jgi:hypothetical protein
MYLNLRSSTKGIILNTLTQQIVTEVRHAQTYSLANVNTTIGASEFQAYGVYFNITTPNSVILFTDLNKNTIYDGGIELINTFTIKNQNKISKICVNMKADNKNPSNCTSSPNVFINATFTRPYPEPILSSNLLAAPTDVDIILQTDTGIQKTVVIWVTGQIAVE